MGCASSAPAIDEEPFDDGVVVRVTDDGIHEHVVSDSAAPKGIKSCKLWGEPLIQDLSDDAELTGFSFIDRVFVQTSCAISNASFSVNTVCVLRERIMAVGAGVAAGAPLLEVTCFDALPAVSVVSLTGETKQVLATIGAGGAKGIADVSRLVAALKAAIAKAAEAGPALTFKVTASCWVSLGGHEGKLEAPPVSVMEMTKDGAEVGLVSVADLIERRRKRLVAKGVLRDDEVEAQEDAEIVEGILLDELGEADIVDGVLLDEAAIPVAMSVPLAATETAASGGMVAAEDKENRPRSMASSMSGKLVAQAAAATTSAAAAAAAATGQASALAQKAAGQASALAQTAADRASALAQRAAEHASKLGQLGSRYASFYADPEEMRLFYAEARLRLKLREAQGKADAAVVEQVRGCAVELHALNTALVVLAHQLRAPYVGADFGFAAAGRQLRASIDAEALRQTGAKATIERRMDVQRVRSGQSPLVLDLKGWDGTTQPGKSPVGAASAAAYAVLFGADGLSARELPELALLSALAVAKTVNAVRQLNMLALACLPGSDVAMGLPTPKIVRLMAQDVGIAAASGAEARARMRSVPSTLRSSVVKCATVAPWLGSTFSTTLRTFCVELRAALRTEGEPPDDDGSGGGDDGGLAADFALGAAELAKAAEKVPDEIDPKDLTA